jgi:hypothetical protein
MRRSAAILCSLLTFSAAAPADRRVTIKLVKPIVGSAALAGSVIHVTTLAADGPGSLGAGITARQPRLIVFDVGGVIDLAGRTLAVRAPHAIIAGQTAPDPGITLIRGSLIVETYDVVVQHIAVRPGDFAPQTPPKNWMPDALGAHRADAGPVYDVVFDHCSATWAIDENLSASGPGDVDASRNPDATAHDVTIRSCLIAEALSHSTHAKGEHSKGTLIHDGVRNAVITDSLYAHNHERNPRIKGGATAIVSGNVMYNWESACIGVGARGYEKMLEPAEVVMSGNVAIPGPDTKAKVFVKAVDPGGRVFLRDNIVIDSKLMTDGVVKDARPHASSKPDPGRVLRTAGSRPARRDPIDARIVASVINGTGTIIDSQEQVGGYPQRPSATRVLEVPEGAERRRSWLERLSDALADDDSLDVTPLLNRIHETTETQSSVSPWFSSVGVRAPDSQE